MVPISTPSVCGLKAHSGPVGPLSSSHPISILNSSSLASGLGVGGSVSFLGNPTFELCTFLDLFCLPHSLSSLFTAWSSLLAMFTTTFPVPSSGCLWLYSPSDLLHLNHSLEPFYLRFPHKSGLRLGAGLELSGTHLPSGLKPWVGCSTLNTNNKKLTWQEGVLRLAIRKASHSATLSPPGVSQDLI